MDETAKELRIAAINLTEEKHAMCFGEGLPALLMRAADIIEGRDKA